MLALLAGLAACQKGPPVTVCVTPQANCVLDQSYIQTGMPCHCGDSKGVAATE